MRLLGSGFTTAATTMAGTTAKGSSADDVTSGVGGIGAGQGFLIEKIVVFTGGTTGAPGSSGAVKFRHSAGGGGETTLIVLPGVSADARTSVSPGGSGMTVTLDGLGIRADAFEADVTIISQGGSGIFVFGE